jgi:hypothetical protein
LPDLFFHRFKHPVKRQDSTLAWINYDKSVPPSTSITKPTHRCPVIRFGPDSLLPLLGYQSLYDEIAEQKWQVPWKKERVDAQGKAVKGADGKNVPGSYCTLMPRFLRPDDSAGLAKKADELGFNNYVVFRGDWFTDQDEKFSRGAFVPESTLTFDDIVDGVSNTLAMSERCIASNKREQPDVPEKKYRAGIR